MKTKNTACPKLFIGIDIHKTSWSIRMATDLFQGKRMTMPSDPENLKRYVEKYYPDHDIHCAYEAGCCGYSAHRAFTSFGWHSIVFNPADVSRTGKSQCFDLLSSSSCYSSATSRKQMGSMRT